MTEAPIKFRYTNYRGETAMRTVQPGGIEFGSTAWHPEPQWLLHGVDLEKGEGRAFALCDCDFTLPAAAAAIAAEADAEIARLRAAQGWQPIETAPKDRTEVLGFDGEGQVICFWVAFSDETKTWGVADGWYEGYGVRYNPTHWMPLPPAPGAGEGGE